MKNEEHGFSTVSPDAERWTHNAGRYRVAAFESYDECFAKILNRSFEQRISTQVDSVYLLSSGLEKLMTRTG